MNMCIVNPTRKPIRTDRGGDGHYGAPRLKIQDGNYLRYRHKGTDFLCDPGQDVFAPVFGKITRLAYPYSHGQYTGLVIDASWITIKMFYLAPSKTPWAEHFILAIKSARHRISAGSTARP